MTRIHLNTAAFRLEEGEYVARYFEIQSWDTTDFPWSARAINQRNGERVQLAVQARGPWSSTQDNPSADLDWNWPESPIPSFLPIVIHKQVPHGGGVLDLAVTPDLPPAFSPAEHPNPETSSNTASSGESSEEPMFLPAPTWLLHRLGQLDRLYQVSPLVEALHEAGFAHGSLTRASFRVDPKGHPRLRPTLAPGNAPGRFPGIPTIGSRSRREHGEMSGWATSSSSLDRDRQAQDLAAMRRLANEILVVGMEPLATETSICQWLPSDSQHNALLRGQVKVVTQPSQEVVTPQRVADWRASLDQMIRTIEAAWLSGTASQKRRLLLHQLLTGDMQGVLRDGDGSVDPWCIEFAAALRDRQHQTTEAYRQWQIDQRDLPLHTSTEQLLELMGRGYSLPEPPPLDAMQRRLTSIIQHLREAASVMSRRDWPRTHIALAAASSLDPANTTLAGLGAITAQLADQRKEPTNG